MPAELSLATVVAAGYPIKWPSVLKRSEVHDFASWDTFSGPLITSDGVE
jgi:hypothetical protein